jgi:alkylation response protein AidB-like acyl-CoA dehydrogenase
VLLETAHVGLTAGCERLGLTNDPRVRQRLAQSWIDVELLRLHNARTLDRIERGEEIGAESSIVKWFWAGSSQRFYDTATNLLGPSALLTSHDPGAVDGGRFGYGLLTTRANSIMGGTSEIQRNILGERVLGLPREPK